MLKRSRFSINNNTNDYNYVSPICPFGLWMYYNNFLSLQKKQFENFKSIKNSPTKKPPQIYTEIKEITEMTEIKEIKEIKEETQNTSSLIKLLNENAL
jgi:hypothetical protein